MIGQQIKSSASFEYLERVGSSKEYILSSKISTAGIFLFKFYNAESVGNLTIGDDGIIKEFHFYSNGKIKCIAKQIDIEENEI